MEPDPKRDESQDAKRKRDHSTFIRRHHVTEHDRDVDPANEITSLDVLRDSMLPELQIIGGRPRYSKYAGPKEGSGQVGSKMNYFAVVRDQVVSVVDRLCAMERQHQDGMSRLNAAISDIDDTAKELRRKVASVEILRRRLFDLIGEKSKRKERKS